MDDHAHTLTDSRFQDNYFRIENAIFDYPGMSHATFRVYCAIVSHAYGNTTTCFPSYTRIQAMTGCSAKTISNAIKWLEAEKFLRVTRRTNPSNPNEAMSNLYTLLPIPTIPRKVPHYPQESTPLSPGKCNKTTEEDNLRKQEDAGASEDTDALKQDKEGITDKEGIERLARALCRDQYQQKLEDVSDALRTTLYKSAAQWWHGVRSKKKGSAAGDYQIPPIRALCEQYGVTVKEFETITLDILKNGKKFDTRRFPLFRNSALFDIYAGRITQMRASHNEADLADLLEYVIDEETGRPVYKNVGDE